MTTRPFLLAVALATSLVLTACAGDDGAGSDTAGLPTAEDLGVEGEPATSGMCAEGEPDCQDTIDPNASSGGAAGSCLAGDEDCTDESYDGQDVARPLPVATTTDGEATPATRGETSGATGRRIEHAALVDEDTLELVVVGNRCMLVQDVLVTESADEVRVLVLGGQDAGVDACEDEGVSYAVTVDLDAPLGTRTLLDLAG